MDALNNLPRPLIIGVAVVLVLIAGFIIFRTTAGDQTGGYGTREEIRERQKAGSANGGHQMPAGR